MKKTPNPNLIQDALRFAAARDALASVLDLIEDDQLRFEIADACAGFCAAFMVGAVNAIEHDAEQEIAAATAISMN